MYHWIYLMVELVMLVFIISIASSLNRLTDLNEKYCTSQDPPEEETAGVVPFARPAPAHIAPCMYVADDGQSCSLVKKTTA